MLTRNATRGVSLALAMVLALALALVMGCAQAFAAQSHETVSATSNLVAATIDDGLTPAAPVVSYAGMDASTKANVKGKGWTAAVDGGKTAGTKSKNPLRSLRISLKGGQSPVGNINYRTYERGKGWSASVKNGKSTKKAKKGIQAVKVWLDGAVSKHYDVLYRVYIKGKGWQAWCKNKSKAGTSKKGVYISAVQVKLSKKSYEALGMPDTSVGVFYESRLSKGGWQTWKRDGAIAGKQGSSRFIDRLAVKLDAGSIAGDVQYRAYIKGKRWKQGWMQGGKAVGTSTAAIQAIQVKLIGDIALAYDVYYRTYIPGYRWLDWAKNGATAGANGYGLPVAAVQVRLVAKGGAAPGATDAPTVALRKGAELDGIDISSWQPSINIPGVEADFVIVKATGGTGYTNPYFRMHADATLKSGKLLGLYHFARELSSPGSATAEADHFVKTAAPYIGKAVLVLDWESNALVLGPSWAKKFLDRVYAKTGVRPLIYMSKSVTRNYDWDSVAASYKLWVAQYPNYNKTGYLSDPWTDSYGYGAWTGPVVFQYTSSGRISGYTGNLDLNKFYGTRSDWTKLAQSS